MRMTNRRRSVVTRATMRAVRSLSANSHAYYYLVFHHRLALSFQAYNLPSLQILPTAALPFFYLNIHYVDSPDCLLLFLTISVFYF